MHVLLLCHLLCHGCVVTVSWVCCYSVTGVLLLYRDHAATIALCVLAVSFCVSHCGETALCLCCTYAIFKVYGFLKLLCHTLLNISTVLYR